jgi:hypothetical protein
MGSPASNRRESLKISTANISQQEFEMTRSGRGVYGASPTKRGSGKSAAAMKFSKTKVIINGLNLKQAIAGLNQI